MMQSENYIYGIHAVEELLNTRIQAVDHIYFDKDKKSDNLFKLMKLCRKERLPYNLVPESKLQQLTGTTKHQGIVALCSVKEYCSIEKLHQILSSKKIRSCLSGFN
jgi:23S rRNA (guanosine2251-2'-O)-methyltransferase